MPARIKYTSHRPVRHTERVPIFWWVHKLSYTKFILRELSSITVACYAVVLIVLVAVVDAGPEAYARFIELLKSPVSLGLHVIGLGFILLHSITWFNLAPKAMVIRIGSLRVPPRLIAGMNYLAWVVISAAVAWMILA